ncbi:hypothetical protein [Enterovirga sp. CN4-39]|uniref:hypothetical protein n=1 Tax=Enterovirga sp. CN4-39 TaxID=3400910 RepID=UPI003C038251
MSANPVARSQSRRAILAGLAASPAFSALAVAAQPSPDAELIALGREFDAISIEMDRLQPEFDEISERYIAAERAWAAQNPAYYPPGLSDTEMADARQKRHVFVATAMRSIAEQTGYDPHPMHDLHSRRDALADWIAKMPAATIEGLAVHARHAAEYTLCSDDFEEDIGDLDWDKVAVRSLIVSLCGVAGVDLRGRPVSKQEA